MTSVSAKILEPILYIDDEEQNLTGFKFTFYKDFKVFTAITQEETWKILDENTIKVVISDQRMPQISGIELLQRINQKYPSIILILMTGYTDLQAIIDAINKVGIFKYIAKPWEKEDVKLILNSAIKTYNLSFENESLIHDLRIAKEKAEESDRLKTAFLKNISHEIRTPLNGMLGFLNLMLEHTKGNPRLQNYEAYIRGGANELLDIIHNIVEMAEIQTEKTRTLKEDFEINALVNSIKQEFKSNELFTNNSKVQLKCTTPDDRHIINSDKIKIKEIYRHLIHNALKFTGEGIVDFGYEINDSQVHLFVKDTGIGINSEDLPHIFDRFWKGVYDDKLFRGLGIGLSITKAYVDDLNGKIEVNSIPNERTEFRVTIPLN